jgi:arginine-tRNA-protein transferase
MTNPSGGALPSLQFFLSGLSPCPYLPDRVERKLFTRLDGASDPENNTLLTRMGFRRSHDILYRPSCPSCKACVAVRVSVPTFKPSRSQRRIVARNADLTCHAVSPEPTDEHYDLFTRYQKARHPDSEMAAFAEDSFEEMLKGYPVNTHLYELRDKDRALMGAMVVDHVTDGASALYSYFRPDLPRRSLGSQLILSLIETMKRQHKLYVYMGYWIEEVQNMAYKSRFQPQQVFVGEGWQNKR